MPDDSSDDDSSVEPGPRRDEAKRKAGAEKKIQKKIKEAVQLFELVKNIPNMWESESMKAVRDLAYEITGDPQRYRPETRDEGFGEGTERLTKNIGALLFGKQLPIMEATADDIYLQITHADSNTGSRDIAGTTVSVRKWKFTAVDGDGKSIVLRIDSTLNTAGNLLTPGTIVKVRNCLPVYFRYNADSAAEERKCALVVREFEVVGRRPLAAEFVAAPKERVEPAKEEKPPAKRARATKAAPSKSHGCACAGEQCSKDGVEFVACITECIPVESVSLPLVARECVFATRELSHMSPRDKRFLLYYYYATTVYQFRGAGNRVELPECLKKAVRARWPGEEEANISGMEE